MKVGFIYITSNKNRSVLYISMTSDIVGRIWEHKNSVYPNSFTDRYNAKDLVYFEVFESIEDAIDREKELKGWKREKKMRLILRMNPEMNDLYDDEFMREYCN